MATNEYVLDNGLKLIVREMHHAPVSAFFVWYRVGARNEVPGITGISHWTEHMMFKGTPTLGKGQLDRVVSQHGGIWNGFTTEDFTAYFEVLPVQHLDLAMEIESDRMVNCLFDEKEVASERTVIISEREGGENSPEFWLDEAVTRVAFLVHPYGQGVIGAKSDLTGITREDLYNHYRTFYAPGNAVAVAAGDFQADQVSIMARKRFGAIPRGPEPPRVRSIEPPQEGERRVMVRRPGGASYGMFAFHVPAARDPAVYPALVLDAILSGGKALAGWGGRGGMGRSSRLYRALVESGVASKTGSYLLPGVDPALLQVEMTLRDGVALEQAERAATGVFSSLMQEKVSAAELGKAKKQVRAQVAYSMESVRDNAMALGMREMLSSWKDVDDVPERIAAVTVEEVLDSARTVLREDNRTVGWFIPEGSSGGETAGGDEGEGGVPRARPFRPRVFFYRAAPRPKTTAGLPAGAGLPGKDQIRRKVLPNGLTLLAYRNPSIGFALVQTLVDAGGFASPPGKEGLARFCASCLTRGTANRSSTDLNDYTDRYGMSLVSSARMDAAFASITALTEDTGRALDLLGEVIMRPAFSQAEVERLKGETIVALRESEKDTRSMAEKAFAEAVYPEGHPYHGFVLGTEPSVRNFNSEDLRRFHRTFYEPGHAIIAIVASQEPEAMLAELERVFGGWEAAPEAGTAEDVRRKREEGVAPPKGALRRAVFIPGKTQCDLALGFPSIRRSDPDYYRFAVANMVLGELGLGGRIGHNVRDKQGLAYYAYSGIRDSRGQGTWVVRAGVNPASVERAAESILDEIRRLQAAPCTEQEISDVKGFMVGSLPISVETSRAMAATMLNAEYFGLGLDYLKEYVEQVSAVTASDVQEMAKKHLSAGDYVLVVTGPKQAK